MKRIALALTLVLVSLTGIGYLFSERVSFRHEQVLLPPRSPIDPAALDALFALRLPDIAGQTRAMNNWRGKVLVVNYWATWCKPCLAEIPMLSKLATEGLAHDVQFVGIAVDTVERVAEFAKTTGATYPWLIGGPDAIQLTREFGNAPQAVPFTLVIDKVGAVRAANLGAIHREALEGLLNALR